MLKKMLLLAIAVGALVALAAPATASAHQWTAEGETLEPAEQAFENYKGSLKITVPSPPAPIHGIFTCAAEIELLVTGTANGTGEAEVTNLDFATESCEGTGLFADCQPISETKNVPWGVEVNATDLAITEPVTLATSFVSCKFGLFGIHQTFNSLTATVSNGPNGISTIKLSGTSTSGVSLSGEFTATGSEVLGVDF